MFTTLNRGSGNNKTLFFDCLKNQFASFDIFSTIPYLFNLSLTPLQNSQSFPLIYAPYNLEVRLHWYKSPTLKSYKLGGLQPMKSYVSKR